MRHSQARAARSIIVVTTGLGLLIVKAEEISGPPLWVVLVLVGSIIVGLVAVALMVGGLVIAMRQRARRPAPRSHRDAGCASKGAR